MNESDRVRRFTLEKHPIRGHAVRTTDAWLALREHLDYPPAVQQLLGEAVGAVLLLAATLKFEGTLTLQLQGKGLVSLLVAQCTHDFKVRAMAKHQGLTANDGEAGFRSLAGEGQIIVTVEAKDRASSYQGVVPIAGDSLSESLETYFVQSEQLPTRVMLAATAGVVSGMLVQRIPGEGGKPQGDPAALESAWMKADHAMAALTRNELLEDDIEQRLVRMFGADEVRVFGGHTVTFECRCSRERVTNVLRSLGVDEVRSVIAEQGAVTVTCEFCQKPYKFDAIDAEQLFAHGGAQGSSSIN
jgi:molecular chaperone Hsp33